MPTLKIDGQEITVDRGTTILQAAMQLGIDVPTFCYHPGLSIAANCRMCLVETNKAPKPLPACHAQVMDGMEVQTQSERIKKVRAAVLEFILLNHPVDCPICDQAGECVLQDHYFKYSAEPSRLTMKKVHKAKAKILGPDVILDAERCILCTRCIRFCDEVAKNSQLEMMQRGEKTEITTFPGKQLDNPYAGNTVDICPVGALTSRDFRFKTRVWLLQSAESVCPECARGCKIRIDTFENVPRRYKPVYNPQVNDWWMCDKGRLSYRDYLDGRIEGPLATVNGKRALSTVAQTVEAAADALQQAGPSGVAVIANPWWTNEDAFLVAQLLTGPLRGAKVYLGGRAEGEGDDILIQPDKNPNTRGVRTIFEAAGVPLQPLAAFTGQGVKAALVFGDEHALTEAQLTALSKVPNRLVVGQFKRPVWELATVFMPGRLHWEKAGTFTNFQGVVQRMDQAVKAAATCKSDGWYAMKIAQRLGSQVAFSSPLSIFTALAKAVPAFAGMDWGRLGAHGVLLGHGVAPSTPGDAPVSPPPVP